MTLFLLSRAFILPELTPEYKKEKQCSQAIEDWSRKQPPDPVTLIYLFSQLFLELFRIDLLRETVSHSAPTFAGSFG